MPPVFKALASITAWAMWIGAWLLLVIPLIMGILSGHLFVAGVVPPLFYSIMFALSFTCGILSVCVMRLRQKME